MEEEPSDNRLGRLAPSAHRMKPAARLRIGVGGAVVLLILALIAAVVVSMLSPHGSSRSVPDVRVHTSAGSAGTGAAGTGAAGTGSAGTGSMGTGSPRPMDPQASGIFVHVLGAVAHPGLFELDPHARVIDAVAAAGGFTSTAQKGGVNLAREVTDGEQLRVPKIGEVADPKAAPGGTDASSGAQGASGPIDLNSATEAELETLPQIGPTMAKRILDWREANGPFTSVEDLMSVTGIGEKTFDGLKDLVTV